MIPTTRIRRPRLETVRRRLERWRATRRHANTPMPPGLWKAAVALGHQHGLYRTARALRLDYGALRRHVKAGRPPAARRSAFIELPGTVTATTEPWAIEIERPGATIRLCVPGLSLSDLARLGRRVSGLEP